LKPGTRAKRAAFEEVQKMMRSFYVVCLCAALGLKVTADEIVSKVG
jgi:hypothetical protein